MMADSIRELWNRKPAPGRIVILAKGPSLDLFGRDRAYQYWRVGVPLIGINEVCEAMPCDYVVTGGDPGDATMSQLNVPSGTIPLRSGDCAVKRFKDDRRSWFDGRGYYYAIDQDIPTAGARCTASQAIHVFCEWARRSDWRIFVILMVGFDAWDQPVSETMPYAKCLPRLLARQTDYSAVNAQIAAALEWYRTHDLQLDITWYHRDF